MIYIVFRVKDHQIIDDLCTIIKKLNFFNCMKKFSISSTKKLKLEYPI